jgi:rod shape-determining protein MreB
MAKNTWLKKLNRKLWHDIGIDLGTANTLIYIRGIGEVINEPSVVALNKKTKQVIAIGEKAKKMIGRAPKGIIVSRPLVDGVVSDYEVTEQMLKYFLEKVHEKHRVLLARPRVVIGLPSGVTEVEKRAVEQAAASAGARKTYLIEEPVAAAIGCRMPVKDSTGSMLVDIGGGSTEVAVISMGGIVVSRSLRIAGDELTESVQQYLRDEFNLQVGETTAEMVKTEIGSLAPPPKNPKSMAIRGRNLITGLPQEIQVSADMIRKPLIKTAEPLISAIKLTLEEAPPELSADIAKSGIVLAGGSAKLRGLREAVAHETNVKVTVSENALNAVVTGCGLVLDDLDSLREVLVTHEEIG